MTELTFVVVGHPNEGKSSVVSTLSERYANISSTSGETKESHTHRFVVDSITVNLIDTPGFQMPQKSKKWMDENAGMSTFGDWQERYELAHQANSDFDHDRDILRSMLKANGLLYIVDASKPVRPHDHAEMAVIRKTGKPRIAIFNSKKDDDAYLLEWQEFVGQEMQIQYTFNAMTASFDETIGVYEKMQELMPDKQAIHRLIEGLKVRKERRLRTAAEVIYELIKTGLTAKSEETVHEGSDEPELDERLREKLKAVLRKIEKAAHEKILNEYGHGGLEVASERVDILEGDLFSENNIQVFGLPRKKLAWILGVAGALAGASIDLALGEISFGIFMIGGGVSGAVSGMVGAKPLSRKSVKTKVFTIPMGKTKRVMQLGRVDNLLFRLVDRAFFCQAIASRRAHARRDEAHLQDYVNSVYRTELWGKKDLGKLSVFAMRVIKGKEKEGDRGELMDILVKQLKKDVGSRS